MTKLIPNEIACKIPGVQIVMNLPIFRTDKVEETKTIEATSSYGLTADKTFQDGKTYYVEEGYSDETLNYVEAEDIVVGEKIPSNTYYEKTDTPEIPNASVATIYECYTDGKWVDKIPTPDGGFRLKNHEHPIEIIRTQIITYSDNGSTRSATEKTHGLGLWAQRETIKYVPIHQRVNADKYGESAGMFRL